MFNIDYHATHLCLQEVQAATGIEIVEVGITDPNMHAKPRPMHAHACA